MKKTITLFLLFFTIFFYSCSRKNSLQSVSEEELFSLNYGNFEDELDLFGITNIGKVTTSITMKDGFFYIVNGQNQKILSFNSYGDLLSVYYNEDFYKEKFPMLFSKSTQSLSKPVSYPFEFDGKIVVDSKKYMYAAGIVPKERNEQDEKENLLYSQVVLRFSSDGTVLDYIGQQGPSGTPFPFIRKIYVNQENELTVVSNTNEGLCVYWFSSDGYLKYRIPVTQKDVPLVSLEKLVSNVNELYVSVENVVPDYSSQTLFVKVDYYIPYIDAESKIKSGVNYYETVVYFLDLLTGTYKDSIVIPPYEQSVTEDFSKLTYKIPYDFLGVTKNGWFYFLLSTQDGYSVQIVNSKTQHVIKRSLSVNHDDILFSSFSLSDEGIISALLAEKEKCRVVWWKTDLLTGNL